DLITLGSAAADSHFALEVVLDQRGAGVRSVVVPQFQEADDYGRPVWVDRATRTPKKLELVPAAANVRNPSYLLYHFDLRKRDEERERPLDTLGRRVWKVVRQEAQTVEGRQVQVVAFQTEVQGVVITKTYSLREREYHLGLEVSLERKKGARGEV